jgi:hypothetical protein
MYTGIESVADFEHFRFLTLLISHAPASTRAFGIRLRRISGASRRSGLRPRQTRGTFVTFTS